VQAADSVAEARWLTAIAATDPLVHRVVLQYEPATAPTARPRPRRAGCPPGGPDTTRTTVAGIRAAVPQFAADLSDVAGFDDLATAAGDAGLVVELLLRPEQLRARRRSRIGTPPPHSWHVIWGSGR
jgi:L-fuconolactonase